MNNKFIITIIIIFIFASCSQKQKQNYELLNLSNPLLEEWFANFKAANSNFSPKKFTKRFYSEEPYEYTDEWYEEQPYLVGWEIVSPSCKFYLDLDYYSGVDYAMERGIYFGGDVDDKVTLVDVRNKKAIDIIKTNSCNRALDAFWINDTIFVMFCQSRFMFDDSDEWIPYISVWNRENEIARYVYDGKIKNLYEDSYSPFYGRLKRLGIKYIAEIHYVETQETIYSITKKYGISQEELVEYNPELKNSILQIDQKLIIPIKL